MLWGEDLGQFTVTVPNPTDPVEWRRTKKRPTLRCNFFDDKPGTTLPIHKPILHRHIRSSAEST